MLLGFQMDLAFLEHTLLAVAEVEVDLKELLLMLQMKADEVALVL